MLSKIVDNRQKLRPIEIRKVTFFNTNTKNKSFLIKKDFLKFKIN